MRGIAVLALLAAVGWTLQQRIPEVAQEYRDARTWSSLDPSPGSLSSERWLGAAMRIHGAEAAGRLHQDGGHVVWWLPGYTEIIGKEPGHRIDPVIEWQQSIMATALAPAAVRLDDDARGLGLPTNREVGAVVFLDQEQRRWQMAMERAETGEAPTGDALVEMPPAGNHLWLVRQRYLEEPAATPTAGGNEGGHATSGFLAVATVWLGMTGLGALAVGRGFHRHQTVTGVAEMERSRADHLLNAALLVVWWFIVGWLLWAVTATIAATVAPAWLANVSGVWLLGTATAGALHGLRRGCAKLRRTATIREPPLELPTPPKLQPERRPTSRRLPPALRTATLTALALVVLAAPAWYGWRGAQRTPFDAPAVQTHGYKAVLFAALGRADLSVLPEPGREFCRPHYPHLFSLLVWAGWPWSPPPSPLATPSRLDATNPAASTGQGSRAMAGVTLISRAQQWHAGLAIAATTGLALLGAVKYSGSWPAGLTLAGLWAWSRPLQGMASMFYAEPLLMLTTTFALLSWARALWHMPAMSGGFDEPAIGPVRSDLWRGGVALAAGIWIKNEGVLWWLAAVVGMGLALWFTLRNKNAHYSPRGGPSARPGVRLASQSQWLAPLLLPGLLAWSAWTGWRLLHGLGESDFSFAALQQRGCSGSHEVMAATLKMIWKWSANGPAPFGGLWCLAALLLMLMWAGGTQGRDGTGRCMAVMVLAAVVAAGALAAIAVVFLASALPNLQEHLVAVWRLMLAPSVGVLLLTACCWRCLFEDSEKDKGLKEVTSSAMQRDNVPPPAECFAFAHSPIQSGSAEGGKLSTPVLTHC